MYNDARRVRSELEKSSRHQKKKKKKKKKSSNLKIPSHAPHFRELCTTAEISRVWYDKEKAVMDFFFLVLKSEKCNKNKSFFFVFGRGVF